MNAPPSLPAAVALALTLACATFGLAAVALFGGGSATLAAIDFNAALFEDFLGPYWRTSKSLLAGLDTPAQGYLYPSTLAWLLAPVAALEPGGSAAGTGGSMLASWTAVGFVLGSMALLLGSVFALVRPRSLRAAATAGAIFGLAHAPVHGAYWAQASLPAIALLAAGLALHRSERPLLAGVAIGLAGALKLHPLVGLIALVVAPRDGRVAYSAPISAVVSFLVFAVALPAALMGWTAFVAFHRVVLERLQTTNAWVMTAEGGRGSQDLPAVLGRAIPLDSASLRRALGACVAALLAWLAVRTLRGERREPGNMLAAFVFLGAIPWATVSPTWPHGLLWIPASWWFAAHSKSRSSWCLAAASFATGSVFALRLAGSPEVYAWYGLPAWSALLGVFAVAAAVFDRDQQERV